MAVKEKIRIRLKSYDASLIDAAAVSYTHLDVYKRQTPSTRPSPTTAAP